MPLPHKAQEELPLAGLGELAPDVSQHLGPMVWMSMAFCNLEWFLSLWVFLAKPGKVNQRQVWC
jgi:hypothetical protein